MKKEALPRLRHGALQLNVKAKALETSNQAVGGGSPANAIEVGFAQIAVVTAVGEHVIGSTRIL